MKIHKRAMMRIPHRLFQVLRLGAWVVGSGVAWLEDPGKPKTPRDLDLVIPPERWAEATAIVGGEVRINRFGGFKAEIDGFEVDIWPRNIQDHITDTLDFKDEAVALRLYPPARMAFGRPRDA